MSFHQIQSLSYLVTRTVQVQSIVQKLTERLLVVAGSIPHFGPNINNSDLLLLSYVLYRLGVVSGILEISV